MRHATIYTIVLKIVQLFIAVAVVIHAPTYFIVFFIIIVHSVDYSGYKHNGHFFKIVCSFTFDEVVQGPGSEPGRFQCLMKNLSIFILTNIKYKSGHLTFGT